MVIELIFFAFGLFLLVKGADYIVESSSSFAKKMGISTLVIGLTVVAFGTSLPELIVNIFAAMNNSSGVAFGNIIGSNIANILLVLGCAAVIGGVNVKSMTVWREIPFALLAAFILFLFATDISDRGSAVMGPREGFVFLSLFAIFLYFMYQSTRYDRKKRGFEGNKIEKFSKKELSKFFVGLAGIYFGGQWVVEGAIFIASWAGLSEFMISATIIALGTSLPELVVTVMAAHRRKMGLAVGNIVGSNIFNILWVFGIIPFISPLRVPFVAIFDIALMFLATLVLFIFMFVGPKREVTRKDGILFLLAYVVYIIFIINRG